VVARGEGGGGFLGVSVQAVARGLNEDSAGSCGEEAVARRVHLIQVYAARNLVCALGMNLSLHWKSWARERRNKMSRTLRTGF
jgi:hypothetical protein